MTNVLTELSLSYAVKGCPAGTLSAVHEPDLPRDGPYRGSPIAPAGSSARSTAPEGLAKSSTLRVRLHLKPGLLAQYGNRLLCVRYRYDTQQKKRFKTVEIVVAERDWEPPRPHFTHHQVVELRVAFADVTVRERVKQAGGTWNPERKVWQLSYDRVIALGLTGSIVDTPASGGGCPVSRSRNLHADAPTPSR